jgi:hypothetical protein
MGDKIAQRFYGCWHLALSMLIANSLWLTITVVPVLTMPLFTTKKVKILFRRKPSGMVANAEREHRMRLRLKGGSA